MRVVNRLSVAWVFAGIVAAILFATGYRLAGTLFAIAAVVCAVIDWNN